MDIKSAPYLQQKSAIRALDVVLFFDALELMLLTKFVSNSNRRWSSGINLYNFDAKWEPIVMQMVLNMHHCR